MDKNEANVQEKSKVLWSVTLLLLFVTVKLQNKSTSSGVSTDAATSSTTTEKVCKILKFMFSLCMCLCLYTLCFLWQKQLERILKGQPCHVVKARIGRFTIHHGSFHTLKPGTYINDEVRYITVFYIDHLMCPTFICAKGCQWILTIVGEHSRELLCHWNIFDDSYNKPCCCQHLCTFDVEGILLFMQ